MNFLPGPGQSPRGNWLEQFTHDVPRTAFLLSTEKLWLTCTHRMLIIKGYFGLLTLATLTTTGTEGSCTLPRGWGLSHSPAEVRMCFSS